MNDITPGRVYRETGRWFGPVLIAGLAVLAIALILGLAGWQAGWWFTAQNATRQYQVTQNGTGNQHTLRDQISSPASLSSSERQIPGRSLRSGPSGLPSPASSAQMPIRSPGSRCRQTRRSGSARTARPESCLPVLPST